jgi:hypothetical protein
MLILLLSAMCGPLTDREGMFLGRTLRRSAMFLESRVFGNTEQQGVHPHARHLLTIFLDSALSRINSSGNEMANRIKALNPASSVAPIPSWLAPPDSFRATHQKSATDSPADSSNVINRLNQRDLSQVAMRKSRRSLTGLQQISHSSKVGFSETAVLSSMRVRHHRFTPRSRSLSHGICVLVYALKSDS